ncbi:MAG: hypothetical protein ACE5I1_23515, partial [bacterium]
MFQCDGFSYYFAPNFFRKLIKGFLGGLLIGALIALPLFANIPGVTGKIAGKVVDGNTGDPS